MNSVKNTLVNSAAKLNTENTGSRSARCNKSAAALAALFGDSAAGPPAPPGGFVSKDRRALLKNTFCFQNIIENYSNY